MMTGLRTGMLTSVIALTGVATGTQLGALQSQPDGAAQRIAVSRPLATQQTVLNKYCVGCHNDRSAKTGSLPDLALNKLDLAKVGEAALTWEKVVNKLRAG